MAIKQSWKEVWIKGGLVGKGGQGMTYLAKRTSEDQYNYVIKFLKKQDDEERRERMYIEVATLKVLSHPFIPKLVDSNEGAFKDKSEEMYMVTEYIQGITLQEFIEKNGPMDLEHAISFTLLLSNVIQYCHSNGFIHRDIKPDNIMLKDSNINMPFLIDFGLSFNNEVASLIPSTPSWQHIGNRFLSLPELRVVEGNKRDYRSDVTMICGILLYCITGISPTDLIDEKLNKPHRREREKMILNQIPSYKRDRINHFFDKAFNIDINTRWQSIESVIIELKKILNMKNQIESEKSTEQKILDIKTKIEKKIDKHQSQLINEIFNTYKKSINAAAEKVVNKLGREQYSTIQTGYSLDIAKQVFRNQLGIHSIYLSRMLFYPTFSCYINGSEYVLEANENDKRTEFSRLTLNEKIVWQDIEDKIVNYYLDGIRQSL